MTRRLVSVAGIFFRVVSVAVYLAQLVVTAGITALAHTFPLLFSRVAVSGPEKLASAMA